MSNLSYEYVWWPASEAYRKDQSISDGVPEFLKAITPHPIYRGIGLEKPYARCIIAWDSVEMHYDFVKSSDFPIIGELLAPLQADPNNPGMAMIHAHFESDPTPFFNAPVTEFIFATVRPGIDAAEARATVSALAEKIATEFDVVGATVGRVEEAPERFVVLVGHRSRQEGIEGEHSKFASEKVDITVEWATFAKKQ